MKIKLECECGCDGTHKGDGFLKVVKSVWAVDSRGNKIQQTPEKETIEHYACVKCGNIF